MVLPAKDLGKRLWQIKLVNYRLLLDIVLSEMVDKAGGVTP
jgi:hypothetical protein